MLRVTELVRLTDDNPLKSLQLADGTWSARDVQKSGYVHTRWAQWEPAIQRGQALIKGQYGEAAGQDHVRPTLQMIGIGKTGQRQVNDYALTALGLFAACQQSQLPELDIWFVHAGMSVAGYGTVGSVEIPREEEKQVPGRKKLGGLTPFQFAQYAAAGVVEVLPDGTVKLDGDRAEQYIARHDQRVAVQTANRALDREARELAALPPVPELMPSMFDEPGLIAFFDGGRATWGQAEEAVRHMLWGDRPVPVNFDFHAVFEAIRRRMSAVFGRLADRPRWEHVLFMVDRSKRDIGMDEQRRLLDGTVWPE